MNPANPIAIVAVAFALATPVYHRAQYAAQKNDFVADLRSLPQRAVQTRQNVDYFDQANLRVPVDVDPSLAFLSQPTTSHGLIIPIGFLLSGTLFVDITRLIHSNPGAPVLCLGIPWPSKGNNDPAPADISYFVAFVQNDSSLDVGAPKVASHWKMHFCRQQILLKYQLLTKNKSTITFLCTRV